MASDDGTRADASVVEQSRSGLAHDLPATQPQEQIDSLASTTPVELSHLPSQSQPYNHSSAAAASTDAHTTDSPETMPPLQEGGHVPIPPPIPAEASSQAGEPSRHRAVSEAIGPNVEDNPSAGHKILQSTPEAGPTVLITLMLLSGARHPYKIDQKYLRKRNIVKEGEPDIDPFGISVYTLKELIWRDWRDEWDPRPTNPGAIRLISFGKLLDDKQTLKDTRFQTATPNVVHMTVKPQEFLDEEENTKGGKASSSRGLPHDDDTTEAGCCRCSVM